MTGHPNRGRRAASGATPLGRSAVALTMALGLGALSMTTVTAADSASADGEQAAGTTRFDSAWVYSLELPAGWELFYATADATGGADYFEGPGGVTARVGGQPAEPGDSVEGRVAVNRGDTIADGTCESDEFADQPTTLGGEPAVAWSWRCGDSFTAAINTLGQGMRLRLEVTVPLDAEPQAAALLEAMREGFAFVGGGSAAGDATVDLVELDQRLQGTYETDWFPVELQYATIEAAGLSLDDAEPGYVSTYEGFETTRSAIQFDGDRMFQYGALDGGPLEVWNVAQYALVNDHTIEATDTEGYTFVYEFTLEDGILAVDEITGDVPQTGFMETLPFTRVP